MVERTFARLCQNRRRDYEQLCTTSEARIYPAMGPSDAPDVGPKLILSQSLVDIG